LLLPALTTIRKKQAQKKRQRKRKESAAGFAPLVNQTEKRTDTSCGLLQQVSEGIFIAACTNSFVKGGSNK
jgi:hypothetical protein